MVDQAVSNECGWNEIRRGPQVFKALGCLATHRCDLEAVRPMCEPLPLQLQPRFHRFNTVGTGDDQPVKVLKIGQGIVERGPAVGGADLQRWQVKHSGSEGLKQTFPFALLFACTGDHDRASQQRFRRIRAHGPASSSSFTNPFTCARRAVASCERPWEWSRAMASRKPERAPSMSPPINLATARF